MTGTHRLRPTQRLASSDVSLVLKEGRLIRQPRLHLYLRPNPAAYPRLALIVPKKLVPRAVDRNRIRRLAREAFRLTQDRLSAYDVVVRLVRGCADRPMTSPEMHALLERAADARPRE